MVPSFVLSVYSIHYTIKDDQTACDLSYFKWHAHVHASMDLLDEEMIIHAHGMMIHVYFNSNDHLLEDQFLGFTHTHTQDCE